MYITMSRSVKKDTRTDTELAMASGRGAAWGTGGKNRKWSGRWVWVEDEPDADTWGKWKGSSPMPDKGAGAMDQDKGAEEGKGGLAGKGILVPPPPWRVRPRSPLGLPPHKRTLPPEEAKEEEDQTQAPPKHQEQEEDRTQAPPKHQEQEKEKAKEQKEKTQEPEHTDHSQERDKEESDEAEPKRMKMGWWNAGRLETPRVLQTEKKNSGKGDRVTGPRTE